MRSISAGLSTSHIFCLLLVLAVAMTTLLACTEEQHVVDPSGDPIQATWASEDRSIGHIHNSILSTYYEEDPQTIDGDGEFRARFRDAVLFHAGLDSDNDPGLLLEVESILNGPAFDVIEQRLGQAAVLIRLEHPDPQSVTTMLKTWELNPADATSLGEAFSYSLLTGEPQKTAGTGPKTPAEVVFYDVFQHSKQYWTGSSEFTGKAPPSEVIALDALGALGGLAFGPIGSIIGGAAYSILWNEAVDDGPETGGCGGCH